ncbi:MAG: M48 family metalloprotease [Rickettsiales bacterium]|nr:M48 family metalloprotease [Rickettsiales bacterium]
MKRFFALLSVFCALCPVLCTGGARAASVIQDTEIESVVYELVIPLARAAGIKDGRLKIHILGDDDFNAFVMGGEDVYIYTGLISRIETPGAFQAVIAHELGHMIGGHVAQMSAHMRAEMMRSMIIQALGVALMVAGGNPGLGMGVMAGAGGIANAGLMSFSRDEERLADNAGLELMVKAGLDPNGFIKIMKQMNDIQGAAEQKINPNRINHPVTAERLENAKKWIAEHKENKKKVTENNRIIEKYAVIQAKIIGYLSPAPRVRAIYQPLDRTDAAVYANSIASMRAGNLEDAKTGTLTLIARMPVNPFYYELLGDIEYQYGHYDDSVKAYEKSLDLLKNSKSPQIQTALALVLSERAKPGDADRAVEMAKRALLVQQSPLAYWVLSRAENMRKNAGASDWAMAEYYMMAKDKKKAREYATRAQKKLPKDSPEYIKSGDILAGSK